jgi:N-acyl-D-aspartate/D-glutamate deacylase
VLEAAQQFIVPGFINPHSHTYERIFTNPDTASALMQGITLELGGVDGRSPLKLNEHFHRVEQQGTGVNYGLFVGHGSIREHILGYARRAPTAAELEQMKVLVKEAVAAGAFGLSSGLEYLPGSYADTAELVALARAARSAGGAGTIYSTHMRSEGPQLEEAVAEALRIAQKSGLTLKLSHFKVVHPDNWHKLDRVLQLINDYRKHGTAVWADTYPYLAPDYTVGLPLVRAASSYPPELVVIRSCGTNRWEGQTLTATARAMKLPPEEAARVISSGSPQATAVALVVCPHCLDRILQEPWSTLCNDASAKPWYADRAAAEELHPRTYGAFPRFLRLYVREKQLLSWEEAVHLLTGRPARFLQLPDRGLIRVGHHADIVVFNPKTVRDTATYSQPQSYPEGIKYVLVNGVLVVEQGQHIEGARPGQLVRNP